ncbi:MAG TPA: MEDS domain-containing protein [Vicinamibacteria bacterium]|jgi:hypothetical protein
MSIQPPWKDLVAEPLSRDHVVQLYRDDRFLIETVALFAGVGIGKGEAIVLVATPSHLEAIERRLKGMGFDVDGLKLWGQLNVMDAAKLLSGFMVNGLPDPNLFNTIITQIIKQARADGRYRKVRVYGEMVELLWRDNRSATARVEQLWNDAIAEHSISLLCGYSLGAEGDAHQHFPQELRDLHSHLVPVEACG